MKKKEFVKMMGYAANWQDALAFAKANNIVFARRKAHLRAWFGNNGNGSGVLRPSMHNLRG